MASKIHTTNYFDTFIEVAEDSPATQSEMPKSKGDKKTVAEMQFDLISKKPYAFTSDDVLFKVFAERNDVSKEEENETRAQFFSKGQPCFRASPLTKRYGFGVHADHNGKIALYEIGSEAYEKLINDSSVKKVKAMRTSKK